MPLDDALGRRAGTLLARTGSSDAIDAAVAVLAVHGDRIITSDPRDLSTLVAAGGQRVELVTV